MIKKVCSVLAVTFLLGVASCSDDNPWMEGNDTQGAIKLSLSTDASVKEVAPQTRAEDVADGLFTVPAKEDFKIHLKRADGSTHTHLFHDEFVTYTEQNTFPVGSYTLLAYAGKMEDEGFDKPYFEGVKELTVLENHTTEVQVEARLANSMVSVEYTDAFKHYMKDYSATVHSEGNSYIDIPKEENKPVFLVPGKVSLAIDFTDQQNRQLKLQPADITAKPGTHHHVTVDVNQGNTGDAELKITFSEELEEEIVTIDLTDELFTAPAPKVNLTADNTEDVDGIPSIEFLAGDAPEGNYRFTVISYGSIKSVKLTVKNLLNGDIELINASQTVQDQLTGLGFDIKGLFRNPDKMAFIDFAKLARHLNGGEYEISVVATDMIGRVSDVSRIKINCIPATVNVNEESSVAFSGNYQAYVVVNYNGSKPADDITFQARNRAGMFEDARVLSCKEYTGTRSIEGKDYIFKLQLPDFGTHNPEDIVVYLHGVKAATAKLPVEIPVSFEADAFAGKVLFKVHGNSEEEIQYALQNVRISDGSYEIDESRITRDSATGIITVKGLDSNKAYTFNFSAYDKDGTTISTEFTTEPENQLVNGGFSNSTETINFNPINTGGEFKIRFVVTSTTQLRTSILKATPDNWATLNDLTCFAGSSNKNTWFMVPSTWVDNGEAVIQSVGYHHNGVSPDAPTTVSTYYNTNAPTSLNRSTGELFLGSYSYDAAGEHRVDGISWSTRPSSLSFDYKYEPQDEENGEVYISILGESNEVLATKTLDISATSEMSNMIVPLEGYTFGKKAKSIILGFKSTKSGSTPNLYTPSGIALHEEEINSGNYLLNPVVSQNNYKAYARGSKLTIDNVTLGYDTKNTSANAVKRKTSNKRR